VKNLQTVGIVEDDDEHGVIADLIWDAVTQMKVGERGQAYVVDAQGRLIAHTEVSLVLRNTDMTQLAQVRAARTARSPSRLCWLVRRGRGIR
jgi:hypothetical protein